MNFPHDIIITALAGLVAVCWFLWLLADKEEPLEELGYDKVADIMTALAANDIFAAKHNAAVLAKQLRRADMNPVELMIDDEQRRLSGIAAALTQDIARRRSEDTGPR